MRPPCLGASSFSRPGEGPCSFPTWPVRGPGEEEPTAGALGWWGGGGEAERIGFPVPSPKPGLDFPGGDNERQLWPTENRDSVIKPSCEFSLLSGQIFFPPPFLLQIIEISGRGSFPPRPCHWPGPCHGSHTPWARASSTPHPTRGSSYNSGSLQRQSSLGEASDPFPERPFSSRKKEVIPHPASMTSDRP